MYVVEASKNPGHKKAWEFNKEKYWADKTHDMQGHWNYYNDTNDFIFVRREGYSGAVYEFKTEADYLMFVIKWS